MAKYVPDVKTQRWVIITPSRTRRPTDAQTSPTEPAAVDVSQGRPVCPFCPGNEAITPPEVYRIGGGEKDTHGWEVRVVPNLYPITDIHEVIIHSPSDTDDMERLPVEHITKVLRAYRDRFRAHERDGHVLIFCNHGLHAGASLTHPHSQLVVIPRQINLDTLTREPVANVVEENTSYITYCPDFSQWPFEVWIGPKAQGEMFGDTTDGLLPDLAHVLKKALQRIEAIYNDPHFAAIHSGIPFGYNFYIYHGVNWYIRIVPRFIHRAGFELGTGLNVNIVDPQEAAERLKTIASL